MPVYRDIPAVGIAADLIPLGRALHHLASASYAAAAMSLSSPGRPTFVALPA